MRRGARRGPALAALAVLAACGAPTSDAELHSDGPPKIEQVRLVEAGTSGTSEPARRVFAFGGHPKASAGDAHPVTRARAGGNTLRIVMDEPLRGDAFQEIACRAVVDDDIFARVPRGATPDDVARCAVAATQLAARCPASNPRSVCLCLRDSGCRSSDDTHVTSRGAPVGVLDSNADGAADVTRFIASAVAIRCDGIAVPIDPDRSQWIPSGNQQLTNERGFEDLGPAVVVVPGALPAGSTCSVAFAPDVVDASGNQVCAPPGGDITAPCTPGDTSAVQFSVEPLGFTASVTDPGQPRGTPIAIVASAPIEVTTLAGITVTEAPATSYTRFALSLGPDGTELGVLWTAADGLAANTRYTITIPTTVTDRYQRGAASAFEVSFTTGAN